ncbi:hypothetical protein EUGRSUZ_I02537 [Eucalyptus grandis]|uniref:CoA carboxyltransferase N-terminal domain-containing protein n=2 Tax=Eucalyptus grandis TaxID=71139 RepID=A0A059ASE0_EUCGR|nr:hypothetical protein EUGRSUZ_I02537 [Eucalyptus grandis]
MGKWWFNSMLYKGKLEYRCGLSKSIDRFGNPIEKTSVSEDPVRNDTYKKIHSWSESSSYSNATHLVGVRGVRNFIFDDTLLVRDSNRNIYSIYFDITNQIFEIDNDPSLLSERESSFFSYRTYVYLKEGSKNDDPPCDHSMYDIKYSWNNHITSCIHSYLGSQICIESSILSSSDNSSDSYISSYIYGEYSNERGSSSKILKSKMNICDQCGYHLKMSSSDRIELSIDPSTWDPMDEDMVSLDPIEFHLEEEPYKDRIDSYQRKTGLTDAVQTGTSRLNDIPIAIGVMDFQFMGGSMGCVVGEKIIHLIEYATNKFLPLILVCASGGARMQEGSLSLMQMAKIFAALYDYQSHKKLFYISILTSPTTGGVTASFGRLGDIIIVEPNAYIAFASKRVIEQTLNKLVPEGSQAAEYLFHKGLFNPIVPRNPLKGVLSELFKLHTFFSFELKFTY